jgi:hypothetical protein
VHGFEPEREHLTYWDAFQPTFLGVSMASAHMALRQRDRSRLYGGIFTDLIREDDTVALGVSYSPQQFEVLAARPPSPAAKSAKRIKHRAL